LTSKITCLFFVPLFLASDTLNSFVTCLCITRKFYVLRNYEMKDERNCFVRFTIVFPPPLLRPRSHSGRAKVSEVETVETVAASVCAHKRVHSGDASAGEGRLSAPAKTSHWRHGLDGKWGRGTIRASIGCMPLWCGMSFLTQAPHWPQDGRPRKRPRHEALVLQGRGEKWQTRHHCQAQGRLPPFRECTLGPNCTVR
jgi:hypothetical protein